MDNDIVVILETAFMIGAILVLSIVPTYTSRRKSSKLLEEKRSLADQKAQIEGAAEKIQAQQEDAKKEQERLEKLKEEEEEETKHLLELKEKAEQRQEELFSKNNYADLVELEKRNSQDEEISSKYNMQGGTFISKLVQIGGKGIWIHYHGGIIAVNVFVPVKNLRNDGVIEVHNFVAPELEEFNGNGLFHTVNLVVSEKASEQFDESQYDHLYIVPEHESWGAKEYIEIKKFLSGEISYDDMDGLIEII